jgi:Protein of unknown function (DUF3460)
MHARPWWAGVAITLPAKALPMSLYESDLTQFVRELMDKNPELKQLQKTNRATWWDKTLDAEELRRQEESAAPKQAYAYFPLPKVETKAEK